jgi:hypothetical protein
MGLILGAYLTLPCLFPLVLLSIRTITEANIKNKNKQTKKTSSKQSFM